MSNRLWLQVLIAASFASVVGVLVERWLNNPGSRP